MAVLLFTFSWPTAGSIALPRPYFIDLPFVCLIFFLGKNFRTQRSTINCFKLGNYFHHLDFFPQKNVVLGDILGLSPLLISSMNCLGIALRGQNTSWMNSLLSFLFAPKVTNTANCNVKLHKEKRLSFLFLFIRWAIVAKLLLVLIQEYYHYRVEFVVPKVLWAACV